MLPKCKCCRVTSTFAWMTFGSFTRERPLRRNSRNSLREDVGHRVIQYAPACTELSCWTSCGYECMHEGANLIPWWDITNCPLKRASVLKLTTRRPSSFMRILVGYMAPTKTEDNNMSFRLPSCFFLVGTNRAQLMYLVVQLQVGCRCHPATEWLYHRQRWA